MRTSRCGTFLADSSSVFVAQALARHADLLLLDEPGAGLDAAGQDLLAAALAAERDRGATVVVATHDIGDAMRADLVLLLARRVVALGPPSAVLTPEALQETFGHALRTLAGGVLVMDSHTATENTTPWTATTTDAASGGAGRRCARRSVWCAPTPDQPESARRARPPTARPARTGTVAATGSVTSRRSPQARAASVVATAA